MPTEPNFYLERPKPDKPVAITLHYRTRACYLKYGTGETILAAHWDKRRHRANESYFPSHREYLDLNFRLDELAAEAKRIYYQYRTERNLVNLTPERFREHLRKFQWGEPEERPTGIKPLEFFESFIRDRAQGERYSDNSIKQYRSTYKHLVAFSRKLGFDYDFSDMNLLWFERFRDYFWRMKKPQSSNNVHKHLSTVKLFLERAVKQGVTNYTEFRHIGITTDLGVKKENAVEPALFMDEIQRIYELDLINDPLTEQIRDLFIIGCFTALRYSDWGKVTKENLRNYDGVEMLDIVTLKTGKRVIIPLHPYVKAIAEKYDWKLPQPPRASAVANRKLKDIARMAGIDEPFNKIQRQRGVPVKIQFQKWERIVTHTARRSFATNGYLAGIPILDLMAITGHSNMKDFMGYVKAPVEAAAHRVSSSEFFKTWKGKTI